MADKSQPIIPIEKINFGGLAYSKWSGVANSMHKLVGMDMHSIPGIVQAEQALTKISSTTVTALCKERINCSNGIRYWFSSTDGKIWQDKAGTITLVHTLTPAAGAAATLGACEAEGYIYIATQSRLHRIAVANADGAAAWTANIAEDWATFTITDSAYHPMLYHPKQQILYIGDGSNVAQVDTGVFSAQALDIVSPMRVQTLGEFGTDVLIGAFTASTVAIAWIFRWNGWSTSYTNSDSVPENGINAFLQADNEILVQAGNQGNIYSYDGTNLNLFMTIPGVYSASAYGVVNNGSVANDSGQILLGFSNGSGNPADQGVYRIARHDRNFPYIIDMPYPISERSGGEFVLSSIEIGGVMVSGGLVYVAWKNGDTYGIDKIDTSTKLNGAYMDTRVMAVNREEFANFSKASVNYASMPASTAINLYMDKNYAGYGSALTTVDDTQRHIVETKDEATDFTTMQLRMKFTCSSNSSPQFESAGVFLQ